jgi:hypothetical protein
MRFIRVAVVMTIVAVLGVGIAVPALADALLSKVNSVRSNPVTSLPAAEKLAQSAANRLAAAGKLFHSDLSSLTQCRSAGEVVAAAGSIDGTWEAFRGSPLHWEIITAPNWTSLGTGVATSSNGTVYVSIIFCELFDAPAPATTTTSPPTTTPKAPVAAPPSTIPTPIAQAAGRLDLPPLSPCVIDRDNVLHTPPWETGACPGIV